MAVDGVVGVAVGKDEKGGAGIVVLAKRELAAGLVPSDIEGCPVRVEIVGEIRGGPPAREEKR
jgi:hypothetical protein